MLPLSVTQPQKKIVKIFTLVRKGFLFAKEKKLLLRLEWLQFGHLFTCTGNCKKSVDSLLRKGP